MSSDRDGGSKTLVPDVAERDTGDGYERRVTAVRRSQRRGTFVEQLELEQPAQCLQPVDADVPRLASLRQPDHPPAVRCNHHKHVKKVAVVTDRAFASVAPRVANHFVSAKVRHSVQRLEPSAGPAYNGPSARP